MTKLTATEARELGQSVRAVCEQLATEARVRAVAYGGDDLGVGGYDAELWGVLHRQVGIGAIALPEDPNGAGYGAGALGVVAHELGRTLAPVPFLASTVLATGLLADAGADHELLAALGTGERIAAAVVTESCGAWDRGAVAIAAIPNGSKWAVTGRARHILHGAAAGCLVVVATIDTEPAIFLVDPAADGVAIQPERVLDRTRPMSNIQFDGAAALRLSGDGPVDDVIERSLDRTIAVLSAEQVGACERVLETATEYACTREQFGRPIGSFQAIKHRCADMLVDLEWARSASLAALQSVDDDDGETRWRASMAKAVCSEALRNASHGNLQIHGGIGFTWEHSAHLYLKRARTDEVMFGGPGVHWDRLAAEAKLL